MCTSLPSRKGVIIALERRTVDIKEEDEDEEGGLAKRYRAPHPHPTHFLHFIFTKGSGAASDEAQVMSDKRRQNDGGDVKKNGFKSLFLRSFSTQRSTPVELFTR